MASDEDTNPYSTWERNFRDEMRRLREAAGMTQTDLARHLKAYGLPFHQQTIQRIEQGDRPVRLNEAHLIATVLEVPLETMTANVQPSVRELRSAVDALRRRAGNEAENIRETMSDLVDAVADLMLPLGERLHQRSDEPTLDEASVWALKFAGYLHDAVGQLFEGCAALDALSGQEPLSLARPEIDDLGAWIDKWREQASDFSAIESTRSLYESFDEAWI